MSLNKEAIQICPVCEKRSVVVWYSSGYALTKLFCLECGRFWTEVNEGVSAEEMKNKNTEKQHKIRIEELEGLRGIISKGTFDYYLDWKSEQLDKEVMMIVEGTISKVIMASLASGIPCDPDTSDGIRSIELCLERLKEEKGE